MRTSEFVAQELAAYYFRKWGAASGCYKCRVSSLHERDDIIQIARIGLAWAMSNFDSTKLTRAGNPVDLKSWSIIIMRSRVNACRAQRVWVRQETVVTNSELVELLQNTDCMADYSGMYTALQTLVGSAISKKSVEHEIIFKLLANEKLTVAEIGRLLKLNPKQVHTIRNSFRPLITKFAKMLGR